MTTKPFHLSTEEARLLHHLLFHGMKRRQVVGYRDLLDRLEDVVWPDRKTSLEKLTTKYELPPLEPDDLNNEYIQLAIQREIAHAEARALGVQIPGEEEENS